MHNSYFHEHKVGIIIKDMLSLEKQKHRNQNLRYLKFCLGMNINLLSLRGIVVINRKFLLDHKQPIATLPWPQEKTTLLYTPSQSRRV